MKNINKKNVFFYFMGFITAIIITIPALFLVASNKQFLKARDFNQLKLSVQDKLPKKLKLIPSGDLLQALIEVKAVYEDTEVPEELKKIVTDEQDQLTTYNHDKGIAILNPNKSFSGYYLKTNKPFTMQPPTLYLNNNQALPKIVSTYLDANKISHFNISSDKQGYRVTFPTVESARKVLLVGDSIVYGYGIDDKHTIASYLQRSRSDIQFYNAGIPGLGTEDILNRLKYETDQQNFEAIVYILFQNDYSDGNPGGEYKNEISKILKVFNSENLRNKKKFLISHNFIPYFNPNFIWQFHFMADPYWNQIEELSQHLAIFDKDVKSMLKNSSNITYIDSKDAFSKFHPDNKNSNFSFTSFFQDGGHLSPLGAEAIATEVLNSL